jgi:hypothetical protein
MVPARNWLINLVALAGVVLGVVLYSSARYLPLQALFDSKAHIDKVELRNAAQALAVMIGLNLPLVGVLVYRGVIGGFERSVFEHDVRALLGQGGLFFILALGGAVAWDSDFIILSKTVGRGRGRGLCGSGLCGSSALVPACRAALAKG